MQRTFDAQNQPETIDKDACSEQGDDNGLLPCPFCGGEAAVVKYLNAESTQSFANVWCEHGHTLRKQGWIIGNPPFTFEALKEHLSNEWNTRTPDLSKLDGDKAAIEVENAIEATGLLMTVTEKQDAAYAAIREIKRILKI